MENFIIKLAKVKDYKSKIIILINIRLRFNFEIGINLDTVQWGIITNINKNDSPIGEIGKKTIISYIFAFLIYSVVSSFFYMWSNKKDTAMQNNHFIPWHFDLKIHGPFAKIIFRVQIIFFSKN